MPKGNSGGEDRAKVKLRVIEFELEGGNASVENSIKQLTNALSTRTIAVPRALAPKLTKELNGTANADPIDELEEAEIVDEESVEIPDNNSASKKAPRIKSKPKPPTYLHDLNLSGNSGTAFKEFTKEKSPTTRSKQYLVAAYWLKEHGDSPTVNADKMYTCFKTAGWSIGFNNWRTTFDNLVHGEYMRKVDVGEFAINPLGEEVVTKGTEV